jgi:hypothetical protein
MPMIFSLSMMDVFCCTLGCVILLWLINQREAMLRSRAANEVTDRLEVTRATLAAAERDRDDLRRQLTGLRADLRQAQSATDAVRADLDAARAHSDDLTKQIGNLRTQVADTEDRLAKRMLAEQELSRQQAEMLRRVADLERLVQDKEAAATAATKRADELDERLVQADGRIERLKKMADTLPDLRDAAASARESATAADTRAKALERDLADARRALDTAKTENRDLAGQVTRIRTAVEQRFEGIALTGKRVVFLVDMSGSMDLIDDRTPAPDKWPGVRDAVVKIMRSLPQLEKFQVVLFSDKASYLLGQDGQWLDYAAATSPDRVASALAAVKPKGNTNMYAALDMAFQFRAHGLDTIYLMSDGLPNMGEGLTPDAARTLREAERTEVLSRYIRTTLKTRWNAAQPGRTRVRINAVGFFYESPEVGAFLWALTRENEGSFVGMSRP